jgi:hypothetical protein
MSAKAILIRVGQFLLLGVLYLVLFMAGSLLRGDTSALGSVPEDQQWMIFPALILVSLVDTAVVMLVILRTLWSGWRLILGVAVSLYGVLTVMAQLEVAWFGPAMGVPASMLPGFFLSSLPIVTVFVPLAVWIVGKARPWNDVSAAARAAYARLHQSKLQWLWKLCLIAVAYVAFYFGFGYVVAWQNPALRNLYGNGTNQAVFEYSRLIPFQLMRGVLWALFALPIIAMDRGSAWKTALVVGIWLALPMNIAHAIPNPIMPDASIRLSHFIETSSSNFLFGTLLTGIVLWHPHRRLNTAPRPSAA